MRRLMQITLSVLLLATAAGAQTPEQSWDNLKTLREGEKIQVVDQKLKSQNGTFVSVTEEAITFQTDKDAVTIQRADLFRVSSKERGRSRGRNALIGFGVGAAIGAGLVGVAMAATGGVESADAALLGTTLMFGGLGAGVTAAMAPGHPTIYRTERRKDQSTP